MLLIEMEVFLNHQEKAKTEYDDLKHYTLCSFYISVHHLRTRASNLKHKTYLCWKMPDLSNCVHELRIDFISRDIWIS